MTGGVERGAEINRRLAAAAQAVGCAMGVGSQRVALEDPSLAPTFRVRDVAPDILLFANLGAVQLNYGYGPDHCRRAVEMIDANALVLHLNPLQEALQVGGNTNWVGILRGIESVCAKLEVPVIVKEVGWGISAEVAQQLVDVGVAAIDIGGAGGTSWSEVERHRAPTDRLRRVCRCFWCLGHPHRRQSCDGPHGGPEFAPHRQWWSAQWRRGGDGNSSWRGPGWVRRAAPPGGRRIGNRRA